MCTNIKLLKVSGEWLHGTMSFWDQPASAPGCSPAGWAGSVTSTQSEKFHLDSKACVFKHVEDVAPFWSTCLHAASWANSHSCPMGRRRAGLSCDFGFRDKCSLPFSGGPELLPAIKTLKSNSLFSREHNRSPPVIKSPWWLWFCQHSPPALWSCSSSLAPGSHHATPSAPPVQPWMHLCNELE